MSKICIGIDTGGTFTDIVAADLSSGRDFYHKVPTTTGDPARGILDGIAEILDQNGLARKDVAFLVLGYVDTSSDGPVEVWYSGSGEVVRMRHGRVVGTTGLSTDWRAVRFRDESNRARRQVGRARNRLLRVKDWKRK